jgi:hypothetical protein
VSPFEADYQLVFMQFERVIDFIITSDGDFISLGATKVVFNYHEGSTGAKGLVYTSELLLAAAEKANGEDEGVTQKRFEDL